MTKRKSFAGRVKAASKRASARPATTTSTQQTAESPATARLREQEIAADPEGTFVPDAAPAAKPIRAAKAARLAKRGGATTDSKQQTTDNSASAPRRGGPTIDTRAAAIKPQPEPDPGYVAVGRVLGPFGLKGELKVLPLTDNPARFAAKAKLLAGLDPVTVLRAREASGHLYLTFKGFPDRDSVDKFRHALLQVPEADLPPLPEGEYYRFQLLGLSVVDRGGTALGTLDEIIETGSNDVYRVHPAEGADVLLPALADVVVSVDLGAGVMVVDPPDWR